MKHIPKDFDYLGSMNFVLSKWLFSKNVSGFPTKGGTGGAPKISKPSSVGGSHTFDPHHKTESPLSVMCPSPSPHCRTDLGKKVSLIAFR